MSSLHDERHSPWKRRDQDGSVHAGSQAARRQSESSIDRSTDRLTDRPIASPFPAAGPSRRRRQQQRQQDRNSSRTGTPVAALSHRHLASPRLSSPFLASPFLADGGTVPTKEGGKPWWRHSQSCERMSLFVYRSQQQLRAKRLRAPSTFNGSKVKPSAHGAVIETRTDAAPVLFLPSFVAAYGSLVSSRQGRQADKAGRPPVESKRSTHPLIHPSKPSVYRSTDRSTGDESAICRRCSQSGISILPLASPSPGLMMMRQAKQQHSCDWEGRRRVGVPEKKALFAENLLPRFLSLRSGGMRASRAPPARPPYRSFPEAIDRLDSVELCRWRETRDPSIAWTCCTTRAYDWFVTRSSSREVCSR